MFFVMDEDGDLIDIANVRIYKSEYDLRQQESIWGVLVQVTDQDAAVLVQGTREECQAYIDNLYRLLIERGMGHLSLMRKSE